MKNRNLKHSDEWYTPKNIYDEWDKEFHFTFDPCPANRPDDFDGLNIEWGVCNFVNPPYSRKLKEAFVKKGIEEWKKGKCIVFLLPVSTSTALFHETILPCKPEIRFIRGRIPFEGPFSKGEGNKGMHDSMLVILKESTHE